MHAAFISVWDVKNSVYLKEMADFYKSNSTHVCGESSKVNNLHMAAALEGAIRSHAQQIEETMALMSLAKCNCE